MDLSDEKTFEHLFLLCFILMLIYIGLAVYILQKKGINISSKKVMLGIFLTAILIVCLPFWIRMDISWQFKFFGPLISAIIAVCYGLGIMKAGRALRSIFKPDEKEMKAEKGPGETKKREK